MIIDTHTHVWSFPSYRDLSQHIKTTEDLIAFRTRYPELYNCSLTEEPVDNSDALIADMDKNGVALTLVQARPGYGPDAMPLPVPGQIKSPTARSYMDSKFPVQQ